MRNWTQRCLNAAALAAFASVSVIGAAPAHAQPDLLYTDVAGITNWGTVGGIRGYSLGSHTCNYGNVSMRWGNSWVGTPYLAMNAYRLHNGRIEQIGQSWVKYSCCAAAGNGCASGTCNGPGSSLLGPNCRDVYSSSYNGGFTRLGRRSLINAFTGVAPTSDTSSGSVIHKRLQVAESDMNAANFPGALYFVEGVYVGSDDAPAGKAHNNASYKRVTVTPTSYNLTEQGSMQIGKPAIYAWKDHGLGLNSPDPAVTISAVDVPGEGRFIVGTKVTDLNNGTWRYDYAVFNLNSDLSGGYLDIPMVSEVAVTSPTFKAPLYHSGEPYDNTPWQTLRDGDSFRWAPAAFATPANANAIRWGTTYSFSFVANTPPKGGEATLGMFKNSALSVTFAAPVPTIPPRCIADVATQTGDAITPGPDGQVTNADFDLFVDAFFNELRKADNSLIADLTNSDGTGAPDGQLTGSDFDRFVQAFFEEC